MIIAAACAHPTPSPHAGEFGPHLPKGASWSYEVKWDGYRTLALKDRTRVQLLSRNLRDATRLYPSVAREVARLHADSVLLDGEIVAVDEDGRPSFQALHHQAAHTLVYYAFDLLHLDGRDLIAATNISTESEPLIEKTGTSRPLLVPRKGRMLFYVAFLSTARTPPGNPPRP